ncbi:centaurin beta [Planoprotostelium fungivorum]|uniref:Centaurin beta n=1 Tax=Planoprotostelium fungivorum TaxID=1890364 RepID=A0A2P6NX20_9EUKA|nr:centaurin beta [Planoprotostelium fungivorum]
MEGTEVRSRSSTGNIAVQLPDSPISSPLRELHPGLVGEKRVWKHQALDLDEVLQDSPKCRDHMRKIEDGMEDFVSKLKRMIKFAKMIQTTSAQLSSAYVSFAGELLSIGHDVQSETIRTAFDKFGNSIVKLAGSRTDMADQINDMFVAPAEEFIKSDVESVRQKRKNYDRANNQYTNALSKLSNLKKKEARDNNTKTHEKQVEHELNDCKREYRTESLNFAFALNDMQAKKHYSLLMSSISFCFAQCDYYKDAWELTQDLQRSMRDIKTVLRAEEAEILNEKQELENYKARLTVTSHTSLTKQRSTSMKNTATTIQGYLFKKNASAMVRNEWQRRYFVVEEGKLLYYKTGKETVPVSAVDLLLCSVKEKQDIDRRFLLQAEDEEKMREWITTLQNATANMLNKQAPARPVETDVEDASVGTALQQIRIHDESNTECADCGSSNPEWASINLGVLMCIECSGFHRSMGVHISKVRSFTLDKWDPENLKVKSLFSLPSPLQYMLQLGNERMNKIYEENMPKESKIVRECEKPEREKFIRSKYQERKWVAKPSVTIEQLSEQLYDDILRRPLWESVKLIAQGAQVNYTKESEGKKTAMHVTAKSGALIPTVLLVQFRGDINATDSEGNVPLHLAAARGKTAVACYFFKCGAKLDVKNKEGQTPLDVAVKNQHVHCVTLLRLAVQSSDELSGNSMGDNSFTHALQNFLLEAPMDDGSENTS